MKTKNNGKNLIIIFCVCVLAGFFIFTFNYFTKGKNWAFFQTNRHVYTNGEMTKIGNVTDRNGEVLSYTENDKRIYSSNPLIRKATIHAVGDPFGYISTGAQNAFRDKLSGYSLKDGFYSYTNKPNDIELTIDSNISVSAMKALGGSSGCVGICNYKTGEMLCMVSTPTYDINDEKSVKDASSGKIGAVYINRFLSSTYTPGSTFKIVTSAAAIETLGDEAYSAEYFCNSGTDIENEHLSCVSRHSNISLKKAFAHSCNAYFSQLGVSLGKTKMTEYAEIFGFNKDFYIDGIKAATSHFDVNGAKNIDLGWSSIGQYTNQMNPLQYLTGICAIANGGEYIEPYFLKNVTDSNGKEIYSPSKKTRRMLKRDTADKVAELMDFAVSSYYGKSSFGMLDVCGKTGTAEIGEKKENSLFVGFCRDSDMPVAFVVVVEDALKDNKSAMKVTNRILQTAKKSLQN